MAMLPQSAARRLPAAVLAGLLAAGCASPAPSPTPAASLGTSPTPSGAPTCPPPAPIPSPITHWWDERVVYELFVRSFADSDGDGTGDLRGATAHLDDLRELGVGAIWLMPVAEAASYHGYDVTDYVAVEPDYGTAGDLLEFVTAAHARDIRVIVDFVPNHTSRDHPWFIDALAGGEHEDWYVWSDTDPGWPSVAGGNPWHAAGGRSYYGAFWEGMPDLNLANPEVTAALVEAAAVWLHDYGVDGFRIDAAKHLIETGPKDQVNTPETKAWLTAFREAAQAVRPDALVLGEVWDARAISTAYVTEGSLDMAFDFGIGSSILSAVQLGDAGSLGAMLSEVAGRYPPGGAGAFLANHDQERAMTTLRGDRAAAAQAAAALLTGPGTPFLYYGEELGLTGTKPDERIRTPYPWTAEDPGHGFTNGTPWQSFADLAPGTDAATEAADPASLRSTYRRLLKLRAEQPVLATGSYATVDASSRSVLAALRHGLGRRSLLVVMNLGPDDMAGVTLDLEAGPLCGTPSGALVFASDPALVGRIARPTIDPSGGFSAYQPLPALPGRATVVIDLSP